MQLYYTEPYSAQEMIQRLNKFLNVPVNDLPKIYTNDYVEEFLVQNFPFFAKFPQDQAINKNLAFLKDRVAREYRQNKQIIDLISNIQYSIENLAKVVESEERLVVLPMADFLARSTLLSDEDDVCSGVTIQRTIPG